jgi:hypothetical protein
VAAVEIPALARMAASALAKFEVSESGSRIHWKDGDVDLSLDGIRAYADPDVRREHEMVRRKPERSAGSGKNAGSSRPTSRASANGKSDAWKKATRFRTARP